MEKQTQKGISLRTKTLRAITIGAVLLILMISLVMVFVNGYAAFENFHDESQHLMDYAMSLLDTDYVEKTFRETKEIYGSIPDEVKDDPFSEEYRQHFYDLVDDDFYTARGVLFNCREETENRNVFLMFTDPERNALVYVVDGDVDEWAYLPGTWIRGDLEEIRKIEASNWRLRLTHEKEYGWIGTDYHTIEDAAGEPIGYIVIDVDMNDFLARVFGFLRILIPVAVGIVLLMALSASNLLRRYFLTPLTRLVTAAKEYTARDKVREAGRETSFFGDLELHTGDEIGDLWKSMSDMETDINDTMRRLKTVTAEQERIEAELSIAKQIQMGTLPHTFPAFPERHEFDIYASMIPAKEVGGDFYDFFLVDSDHLAMMIADVSGKGISAALFMVNAKALIRNQTMANGTDVVKILETVNEQLLEQNEAMMFVTVWLGILTISTGQVVYANAGHEYPAVCRNGSRFAVKKDVHSGPLAALEKMPFRAGEFTLEKGDTVFAYTDGVTEANNSEQELFGTERMLDALNTDPGTDPETLDRNLHEAIRLFAGDTPQFDDMTMLCLKYFGPEKDA